MSTGLLQATKISARGGIIRKINNDSLVCTTANSQGLSLQSVTYVHRPWRGGKAGEPLGHEVRGVHPTVLSSGADVEDMTGGTFTLNGLVGILATNIAIVAGSATMHGAAGPLFGFSDDHVQTGSGIATDIFASARQFSGSTFQRSENKLNLTGSTTQQHIAATDQRPLSGTGSRPNTQAKFVKPLFTSGFFQTQSLPTQALTFLKQGEKPIELPGGCSFRDAYQNAEVSKLELHQARNLPTPFSLQDMEMLYDMSHGGVLHKTTIENTFLETLAHAFEFSRGTGYIDLKTLKNFNKPFTVFAVVKHNGASTIRPYTITPKEYYEDRAKLAISTLLASNAFYLKTDEDIVINRLAIKAKTIDVTGRTLDFNRFATFSEGNTTFAAQSFLLNRAGNHKAKRINFLCGGPIHIGEDHDVYEHRVDTKDYKEHTVIRTSVPTKIEADYAHFESLGGQDITFVGTQIDVPQSKVITPGGRVHFKLGTNTYYSYRFEDDSNAMMTDKTTTVQQDKTYVECKINGIMDIEGATKVIVEKVQKKPDIKGLNSAFLFGLIDEYEDAGSIPDPEFVKQLRGINPDMLEYILTKEVHEFTETNISAPGAGLMAVVAVAVTVLTQGMGASAYASLTGTTVKGMSTVAVTASNAAFSSLCVQSAGAVLQNGGDPFKAMESLMTVDTLKNLAIAAATAGACDLGADALAHVTDKIAPLFQGAAEVGNATKDTVQGMSGAAQTANLAASGIDVMKEVATFASQARDACAHAVAGATIQTVAGEKGAFKNFATTALSSAVMRYTGGKIATAELSGITEKLAHAASGAAFGAVVDGEKGAISGAAGAFIASSVTSTAHASGVDAETSQKLGAIASALPAFWHEYNVGIGSTAGMNAASATKDGIAYRLKAEADRQALADAKRLALVQMSEKTVEIDAHIQGSTQTLTPEEAKAVKDTVHKIHADLLVSMEELQTFTQIPTGENPLETDTLLNAFDAGTAAYLNTAPPKDLSSGAEILSNMTPEHTAAPDLWSRALISVDDTITSLARHYPNAVETLVWTLEKTGIVMDYIAHATATGSGFVAGGPAGAVGCYVLYEGATSTVSAGVETGLEALVASVERSQGARAAKAVHNLATRGLMVAGATGIVKGAKGVKIGVKPELMALAKPKMADHHVFPRQFKGFFESKGINIDEHTISIVHNNTHLRGIHGSGFNNMPGKWNQRWKNFIETRPDATQKDVYQFAGSLLDEYQVNNHKVHGYRK